MRTAIQMSQGFTPRTKLRDGEGAPKLCTLAAAESSCRSDATGEIRIHHSYRMEGCL